MIFQTNTNLHKIPIENSKIIKHTPGNRESVNIERKREQKWSQGHQKWAKGHQKWAKRKPKGTKRQPRGAKREPKVSQGATKMRQRTTKMYQKNRPSKNVAKSIDSQILFGPFWKPCSIKNKLKIHAKIKQTKLMKFYETSMGKWNEHYLIFEKCVYKKNVFFDNGECTDTICFIE